MKHFSKALHILLPVWLVGFHLAAMAQPVLNPYIGLNALPNDTDTICVIPLAIDSGNVFQEPGLQQGDTIPDFQLYTLESDSVHVAELLADGKPVLLIGGSYTCPKYRNRLDEAHDLQALYGSQVHIYIVYTVEAHPASPDISPYKGEVWQLNSNNNQGIVYHEAITYADRKQTATEMMDDLAITIPVLLDGPCNEWWQHFALAPNPAFLIASNGTIFKKQGWFDNSFYAISDAIDSLLNTVPTGMPDFKGNFTVMNDPSTPEIKFYFPTSLQDGQLRLIDSMGRMVRIESGFSGNHFSWNKSGLAAGVYIYSIRDGDRFFNGQILIQ